MKVFSKFKKVTVDGVVVLARDGATFDPGGESRSASMSLNRVDGYTSAVKPSKFEGDITWTKDSSIDQVRNWADVTLQVETDTGQVFVVRNAWSSEPPTLTAGANGAGKISIEGPPAEEIL